MKTTNVLRREDYSSPALEIIEVSIEQGFATSPGALEEGDDETFE